MSFEILEKEIEMEFNTSLKELKIDEHDDTRRNSLKIKRARQLDATQLVTEK